MTADNWLVTCIKALSQLQSVNPNKSESDTFASINIWLDFDFTLDGIKEAKSKKEGV